MVLPEESHSWKLVLCFLFIWLCILKSEAFASLGTELPEGNYFHKYTNGVCVSHGGHLLRSPVKRTCCAEVAGQTASKCCLSQSARMFTRPGPCRCLLPNNRAMTRLELDHCYSVQDPLETVFALGLHLAEIPRFKFQSATPSVQMFFLCSLLLHSSAHYFGLKPSCN